MLQDEAEVTVNGVSYKVSTLSEEAQAQVSNLQFVDKQMVDLRAQLAVYQTARNAYESALQQMLPHTTQ